MTRVPSRCAVCPVIQLLHIVGDYWKRAIKSPYASKWKTQEKAAELSDVRSPAFSPREPRLLISSYSIAKNLNTWLESLYRRKMELRYGEWRGSIARPVSFAPLRQKAMPLRRSFAIIWKDSFLASSSFRMYFLCPMG